MASLKFVCMIKDPKVNFLAKLFIGAALATGLGGGAKMLSDANNSETAEEKLYREKVAETGDEMAEKYRKEIATDKFTESVSLLNKIVMDYKSWFSESYSDDRYVILQFLARYQSVTGSAIGRLSESDQDRFERLLEASMKWSCYPNENTHSELFPEMNDAAILRRKLFPKSSEIIKKSLNNKVSRIKAALRDDFFSLRPNDEPNESE